MEYYLGKNRIVLDGCSNMLCDNAIMLDGNAILLDHNAIMLGENAITLGANAIGLFSLQVWLTNFTLLYLFGKFNF